MSQTIEVKVYDAQELKAEAIRRWPQRGMQLHPNVLLDELMAVAGIVRNGLFIIQGVEEWGDLSPLSSLMEFCERYYETTDAYACFKHAEVEWRYSGQGIQDYCDRIGLKLDELPKHPSMIRESQKAAKSEPKKTAKKSKK